MLVDAYGRPLNGLRIIVTPECNLSCFFCHLEGDPHGSPLTPGFFRNHMTPEEYDIVAEAASSVGIDYFKVTGGEPLIRRDIVEIVGRLSGYGFVSMTTNGVLLDTYAEPLYEAGLRKVNVSVHHLDPKAYKMITGRSLIGRVLRGIEAALDTGMEVKVNVVLLKGINESHVWSIIGFAEKMGLDVQIIELIPVGRGRKARESMYASSEAIEKRLAELGARRVVRRLHNRPIYVMPSGIRVELVRPVDNPYFCMGCERVRLTSRGELIPCINWKGPGVDVLKRIRSSKTRREALERVVEALVEVNYIRRPYALYGPELDAPMKRPKASRISHPKKRSLREVAQSLYYSRLAPFNG